MKSFSPALPYRFAFLILFSLPFSVSAETVSYWIWNYSSVNWNDPYWSTPEIPGNGNTYSANIGNLSEVTYDSNYTIGRLEVGVTAPGAPGPGGQPHMAYGTLFLDGGTLTSGDAIIGVTNTDLFIAELHLNGTAWNVNGNVTVGGGTNSIGTLNLTSGSLSVNNGNVVLGNGNNSTGILNLGSGNLNLNGNTLVVGGVAGSTGLLNFSNGTGSFTNGEVTGGAGAGTVAYTGGTRTIDYKLSGSLSLSIQGGRTTLTGDNHTYTGGTSITGGTLSVTPGAKLPDGEILVNGGTLELLAYQDQHINFTNPINGTSGGSLVKDGDGILFLSAPNTFHAVVYIKDGILALGHSLALQNSHLDYTTGFSPGLFSLGALTSATLGGLSSDRDLDFGNKNLTIKYGNLTGNFNTTGILVKAGNDLQVLELSSNANNTGETHVNGGGLQITGLLLSGGVGVGRQNDSTARLNVSGAGAYLHAGAWLTVGDNPGSTGTLTVENGALVALDPDAKLTIGWNNANGLVNLNSGGTLEIGGTDGIQKSATSTGSLLRVDGGTLRVVNSDLTTDVPISVRDNVFTVDTNNAYNATFNGLIYSVTGGGTLLKTGGGTLNLTGGFESYWLTLGVNEGTLSIAPGTLDIYKSYQIDGGTLQTHGADITTTKISGTSGTFDLGGGTLTLHGSVNSAFSGTITGLTQFTKQDASSNFTLGGVQSWNANVFIKGGIFNISGSLTINNSRDFYVGYEGAGGLTVQSGASLTAGNVYLGRFAGDSGTATIAGALTAANLSIGYQGTGELTLVSGGTINVGSNTIILGNSNGSSGMLNFGAGGLSGTTTATTIHGQHANGGGTVNFNHIGNFTLGANLTGNLTVTKNGTGTTTLTGTNTYTGATYINAGTLRLGSAGSLSPNTTLQVAAGATFDANGFQQTFGGLSGNGSLATGTGNIVVQPTASNTFGGQISGDGGLTLDGPGTLTLTTASDYSGGTEILDGTLVIVDVGIYSVLGTGDVFVGEDGTLAGSGHVPGNTTIAGTLSPGSSPGQMTFDGNLILEETATLTLEIGGYDERGVDYDAIDVTGQLTLAGTLEIAQWDDFVPSLGDSFGLLSFGSISGTFDAIDAFAMGGGLEWDFSKLYIDGSVSVVPEPGVYAALAGLLGLAFVLLRRKARSAPYGCIFDDRCGE